MNKEWILEPEPGSNFNCDPSCERCEQLYCVCDLEEPHDIIICPEPPEEIEEPEEIEDHD